MRPERTVCAGGSARPRPTRASWRRAVATLVALFAISPLASAQSDCQAAFERWTKLSSARVVPQGGSQRGACIPSEAVRQELLGALGRTRGLCADSGHGATRTVLDINQTFIASLSVCHSGTTEDTAPTKEGPGLEKPTVAVPLPPPPAPKPPPAAPKPVVVAPPPAPPPTPPCLEVAPAKEEQYALVNRRCRGHTVLAVIETRGAGGETVCKGYSISQSQAVRTAGTAPPRINHECVLSQGPCNRDRLESMFPECDW
jgi:hypothetical protein